MAKRLFESAEHAKLYNAFRPSPPTEVISKILNYLGTKFPCRYAVDVGCGTGQSTVVLSPHFQHVTGFDISEAQITEAVSNRKHGNIDYKVAPAEDLPVANESVDLVTSFASLHWFDLQKFFAEVKRILVPSGVLAIVGQRRFYPISEDPEKNRLLSDFYKQVYGDTLKPYMTREVHLARDEYKEVDFPFSDVQRESGIITKFSGNATNMVGYAKSTSFFQTMQTLDPEKARNLIETMQKRLKDILEVQDPLEDVPLNYHVEYYLTLCRKQ